MSSFERKFLTILEQSDELPARDGDVDMPGENPSVTSDTVDIVDDVGSNPSIGWRKEANGKQRSAIQSWIVKLEEFKELINGIGETSIQAQLNNADCDTLFNSIAKVESRKLSRTAQEVSSMIESFKGHLLSGDE